MIPMGVRAGLGSGSVRLLQPKCPQRHSLAEDGEKSRASSSAKDLSSINVPRSLQLLVGWSRSIRQQLKKRHLVGWSAMGRG